MPALSRRVFLQTAGLAGSSVLGASHAAAVENTSGKTPARDVDVLVCGGGCAGVTAALAASRAGAKTLLVERAGFAGGIITAVGLPYFDGIADIKDNRVVVRGIALELLAKSGVCAPDITHTQQHNPVIRNVERFKLLADQLFTEQRGRLDVLYHSSVCAVETVGDRISAVMIANKGGLTPIRAKQIIDCTGDADVAFWAGAPTDKSPELQPLTLHFRIGNVQSAKNLGAACRESLEKAHERGELPMFYGPGVMFMFAENEIYVHGIRVPADATDPVDLTRAEMQGRADAWAMFEAWKRDVPAFAKSYFMMAAPFIGVRETRRIVGQHVLTEQEIMRTTQFDDAIATGCWYLDLHPNKVTLGGANAVPKKQPAPYDIPYRTLLPQKLSNLLVAGRCHSATQLAASSTRVTVTAMAMGEAAGTAAALALKEKKSPQELNGPALAERLARAGAGASRLWT